MSEPLPPADDELDGILPTGRLDHASGQEPPSVDFKPWHLPRKHHVRKHQWGLALAKLIVDLPDRQMINYLGLPGEDLLDVQILADVCKANQRRLKYLGFDQPEAAAIRSIQRVAAEQILRQTNIVEATSEVIPDGFASIARADSLGSRQFLRNGSYDLVNLDMCDAFTSHPHAQNHGAVLSLLNHQSNRRGEPWLLFLTTRAETHRLQQEELTAYDAKVLNNIQNSKDFRDCLIRILGLDADAGNDALIAQLKVTRDQDAGLAGRWLAIAIGKWLLGIMAQPNPWRVDLLSVFCYRTGLMAEQGVQYAGEPPNLFSLAFRMERIRQVRLDPAGLAPPPAIPGGEFDEPHLAKKIAGCVEKNTIDLDVFLEQNIELNDQLKSECESLLSVRYYSPDEYRKWITRIPRIAG